ncbi:MAG: hypothetical protein LBQ79_09940 [Deltaproteobacteria bacterium]|nr:hypothetical protein [Deltaproteobacteria bacterium]
MSDTAFPAGLTSGGGKADDRHVSERPAGPDGAVMKATAEAGAPADMTMPGNGAPLRAWFLPNPVERLQVGEAVRHPCGEASRLPG